MLWSCKLFRPIFQESPQSVLSTANNVQWSDAWGAIWTLSFPCLIIFWNQSWVGKVLQEPSFHGRYHQWYLLRHMWLGRPQADQFCLWICIVFKDSREMYFLEIKLSMHKDISMGIIPSKRSCIMSGGKPVTVWNVPTSLLKHKDVLHHTLSPNSDPLKLVILFGSA